MRQGTEEIACDVSTAQRLTGGKLELGRVDPEQRIVELDWRDAKRRGATRAKSSLFREPYSSRSCSRTIPVLLAHIIEIAELEWLGRSKGCL